MVNAVKNKLLKIPSGQYQLLKSSLLNFTNRYKVNINLHQIINFENNNPELKNVLSKYLYHNNALCNFIKRNKVCFPKCIHNKSKLFNYCLSNKEPFIGKCYMGLYEIIYPVFSGTDLITIVCIGQFDLDLEKDKNYTMSKAKLYGIDTIQLDKLYQGVSNKIDIPIFEMSCDLLLICELLKDIHRKNKASYDSIQDKSIVKKIIEFIDDNYYQHIDLTLLSQYCYTNPAYLSYMFKQKTGINVVEFINKVRIEKAKEFLNIYEYPITDIAHMCGFQDSGYFSTFFKKYCAISPSEYRNNLK